MTLPLGHPFKIRAPLKADVTPPVAVANLTWDTFKLVSVGTGGIGGSGSSAYITASSSIIAQRFFDFPYTGEYTFTVSAFLNSAAASELGNAIQILIDQIPCAAVGSAPGNDWVQIVANFTPSVTQDYVFKAFVLKGQHSILYRGLYAAPNSPSQVVSQGGLAIATTGKPYPADPPGSRDPYNYPMSSGSQWNSPITTGAVWSSPTDADTARLIAANGVINGGTHGIFSGSFYQGQVSDPDSVWFDADNQVTPDASIPGTLHALKAPTGMIPGPPTNLGGDRGLAVSDAANKRYLYGGFGVVVGAGTMLSPTDHAPTVGLPYGGTSGSVIATAAADATGSGAISRTYHATTAKKIYCEATASVVPSSASVAIGLANAAPSLTAALGSTNNSIGYFSGTGQVKINGAVVATLAGYGDSDAVDMAADATAKTIQFRVNNGSWSATIDISAISGPYFFACDTNKSTASVAFNFGMAPGAGDNYAFGAFARAPLTGFIALGPANTISPARGKRHDMYNGANWGLAQDESYVTGTIRQADLNDGMIAHQLLCGLATQMVRAGTSVITGLGWPTCESDYNGPYGLYTGPILYGCKVGIPASTPKPTGLSAGGSALWDCLVNYGAINSITGGQPSENFTLFAEEAIPFNNPLFAGMQTDFTPLIMPALRIMRNHTAATPNGGGVPLVPPRPGLMRDLPMIPVGQIALGLVDPGIDDADLTATPFSPTQINLSWPDQGAGSSYDIYRDSVFVMSSISTSYFDGGLDRTSAHSYTVNVIHGGVHVATLGPTAATSLAPEPQNFALFSQNFANSPWFVQQCTVDATLYTAPDSTLTANALIESTNAGLHQVVQFLTLAAGTIYTFTIYAKAGGRPWLGMNIQDSTPRRVMFDLVNGVVGSFPGGDNIDPHGTINIPSIDDAGNGWWRCSMTSVSDTSGSSCSIAVQAATGDNLNTDGSTTISYVGNGALATYLWGAQIQQNWPATSYVKTLGSPVSLSGIDRSAPTVPASVYAIPTGHSSTSITWNPASDDTSLASYEIFRNNFQIATISVGAGAASALAGGINPLIGSGLGNWHYDTGLQPSTGYDYYVRSVDSSGNRSGFSVLNSCSTVGISDPDPKLKYTRPATLPEPNPTATTLRAKAATNFGLYFGTMVDPTGDGVLTSTTFDNRLVDNFNMMAPGNQFKWPYTEPSQGTYNFAPVDPMLAFAQANGLKVRGHNLLWGADNPSWLQSLGTFPYTTFTPSQLQTILVNHINAVIGHCVTNYPGLIYSWDVTNEVMGWNADVDTTFSGDNMLWTTIGTSADGLDYLRLAFETARAADPDAILVMNDYGNLGNIPNFTGRPGPYRSRNMLNIVRYLKLQGTPIDAVGFEAHGEFSTYEECIAVMKEYRDMGVAVMTTEVDYTIARTVALPAIDTAGYDFVAGVEGDHLLAAALDSPNCIAFNLWGFDGEYAALYGQNGSSNLVCYPWDTSGNESPIYAKFYDYLAKNISTPGGN